MHKTKLLSGLFISTLLVGLLAVITPISAQSSQQIYLVPSTAQVEPNKVYRADIRVGNMSDNETNVVELRLNFSLNVEIISLKAPEGFLSLNEQLDNSPATLDIAKVATNLESDEVIAQLEYQVTDDKAATIEITGESKIGEGEVGSDVGKISLSPAPAAPAASGGVSPVLLIIGMIALVIIVGLVGGYGISVIMARRMKKDEPQATA